MLIRLTIDNVLSFNTEQEILLTPGKNRNHTHHIIKGEKARDIDILKAAVIYGANASGKSNLIKAMALMQRIVLHGDSDTIVYDHFKLDGLAKDRASKLEVEFYINGRYFAYGFTFTRTHIESEWLYTFNKEKDFKVPIYASDDIYSKDGVKLYGKELQIFYPENEILIFLDKFPHQTELRNPLHAFEKSAPSTPRLKQ